MSNKRKNERLIPSYGCHLLIAMVLLNGITYYGTRLIHGSFHFYNLSGILDDKIPLSPVFILFYAGAYLQWVLGYILIAREEKYFCCKYIHGEYVAKLICLVFFLVMPTTMVRPELTGNDIFSWMLRIIYKTDMPDNLFPSIHCLESWICFRGIWNMDWVKTRWKWLNLFMTIGVCLSTVFCKQHVVADIIAGILVAELGLYISFKMFNYLERN